MKTNARTKLKFTLFIISTLLAVCSFSAGVFSILSAISGGFTFIFMAFVFLFMAMIVLARIPEVENH